MRLLVVNGVLVALLGLGVVALQFGDRSASAVEASVRRYAIAVTTADLDGAMAEIAPDQRARWKGWVANQLGNVYEVRGIAVRSHSQLERVLARAPGGPFEVTTIMDVNRTYTDEFYQPTTHTPVERADTRWYLSAPLLAQED
jgi:hypothetical protein